MCLEGVVKRSLAGLCHSPVAPGEDLLRGKAGQTAVMVLQVVPVDIGAMLLPGVSDTLEPPGVVRLVLAGLELTFTEGIVADSRSAMAARHSQRSHEVQVTVSDHRRPSILVEGQRPVGNAVTVDCFLEELLGQRRIFLVRYHPGHDKAAV